MKVQGSAILEVGVELVFHTIVLFSLYLLFAGHNRPGGGFVGGLVLGSVFAMRFLATGRPDPLLNRVRAEMVIGVGLLVALVTATTPVILGDSVMEASKLKLDLPIWGDVSLYSHLFFDLGVFLVVLGLTSAVIEGLGKATGSVRTLVASNGNGRGGDEADQQPTDPEMALDHDSEGDS